MIYITGDTHADFSRLYLLGQRLGSCRTAKGSEPVYVIICGDFGGVWNDGAAQAAALDRLNELPFTTLFLDGNHENYDLLATYPEMDWHGGRVQAIRPRVLHLLRGQIYGIDKKTFFAMGGAACHDIYNGVLDMEDPEFEKKYKQLRFQRRFFRINHVSWWEQELPTRAELDAAWENLLSHGKRVDYVLTHCAPTRLQKWIQAAIFDDTHPVNELTEFLQRVYDECAFKGWYCGHYHRPMDDGDRFHVLYEPIQELPADQ